MESDPARSYSDLREQKLNNPDVTEGEQIDRYMFLK